MKIGYNHLSLDDQRQFALNLNRRRESWVGFKTDGKISPLKTTLIIGDRPGPGAPKEPGYHHTAFYSTKHCSGWLNAALVLEGIKEDKLLWVNSADENGTPLSPSVLEHPWRNVIVLGGNAKKWLQKNVDWSFKFHYAHHPQYHKRFKNNERYELLDLLTTLDL